MNNIKLNSLAVMFLAAGLFLACQAYGQQMNGGGRHMGDRQGTMSRMPERHFAIPNLTDDQKQKIEKLRLEFDRNTLQTHNSIGEKEAQLRILLTQDKVNQDQVDKLIDDIGNLRTSIRKERVKTELKVRDLLTDDQKVIFDTHLAGRQRPEWNRM